MAEVPPVASSAFPARPGNLVRPLIDGEAIFRRIGQAIAEARHSVWLTVAFYASDFHFPEGCALFDVLDDAVARGLDVRVIFWRPTFESNGYGRTFAGTAADRELLQARRSRFKIRWDRAEGAYCQHQKSWVIDAGHPSETAFTGGANLTAQALERHDVYVEVVGPSATDIRRNFVQRWNGASERLAPDGNWACEEMDALPAADRVSVAQGPSIVQIQRTHGGERSILDQYRQAIEVASRTIFLVHQALPVPEIAEALDQALHRGVSVILVVPTLPEPRGYTARQDPGRRAFYDAFERLGRYPHFLLAGLAERRGHDQRFTYVHAKVMVVDDAWATIGSCNLHAFSLCWNSEMNASIWDASVAETFRRELFARHLGGGAGVPHDRASFDVYARIARENRAKLVGADGTLQGAAVALRPDAYGKVPGALP